MNFSYPQVVLQEVPGHITLALSISGCPLRCKGCHSTETYDPSFGEKLTIEKLNKLINKHISCVLFYGGEWNPIELIQFLKYIQSKEIKTALYTGYSLNFIHKDILDNLNYIKTEPYKQDLGGIDSPTTNQKFFVKINGEFITRNFNEKNL